MARNDDHEDERKRGNGDAWRGLTESTKPRDDHRQRRDERSWNGTADQRVKGNGDAWKGLKSR